MVKADEVQDSEIPLQDIVKRIENELDYQDKLK